MVNIKNFMTEFDTCDYSEEFTNCTGYICDIISFVADDNISIWTYEQIEFAHKNDDFVKEALWQGIALSPQDFFRNDNCADIDDYLAHLGVAAWYEQITCELYEHLENLVTFAILSAFIDAGIEELTENQIDAVLNIDREDSNEKLEDIIENAFCAIRQYEKLW